MATASPPPPAPQSGERVLAYLRELREWCRRNMPVPGAGMTGRQTPDGRILNVLEAQTQPMLTISQTGPLSATVKGGKMPTSYADKVGTATVAEAEGFFAATATTNVYLKVDFTTSFTGNRQNMGYMTPTGAEILFSTSTATALETGEFFKDDYLTRYYRIGKVTTVDSVITEIEQELTGPFLICLPQNALPGPRNDDDDGYKYEDGQTWFAQATFGGYIAVLPPGTSGQILSTNGSVVSWIDP